ncbi:flavoprotein [Prauserella marina]|uniref:Flavoprotein n=1 Tax=Prauserella marina TaxID=530584 RepID=A0A222VSI1_9PSEU|nr:flavoprotein [Prauserella marina]ASR36877.1 flavoprotein [Prauserella marina]PWV80192.1 flavoprotein [Prauserella marina]SDD49210.1 Flavoprotein [Prauserella marina]
MTPGPVLGLVASSCGGVESRFVTEIAEPAALRGWRLAVTLTPTAHRWLTTTGELERLRALTGLDVRSESRLPGEERPHPDPEVFLFAPASAGSVAKLALGLADNQATTVLGDALGEPGVRMVVGYQVRDSRFRHPAWQGHLDTLASAGVTTSRLAVDRPWTGVLDLLE